jgi:cytochrome c553
MHLRIHHWLPVVLLSFSATGAPKVSQHDAIPVLLRRCVMCHGQDAREGGLDLRTKFAMLKGKAFVSGKPNESAMIKRIVARQCPPDKNISMAGIERMAPRELHILRDWIAAGAPEIKQVLKPITINSEAREHWAFQPPKRPAIPQIAKWQSQIRNPIDTFLLRKLVANKLEYSPEASKLTLLRRVTFDLTGLPPTPAEMVAFEKDRSLTAFEKVVERLLASPAYGVRWGRHWLDLAGYSDSEGKRNADMIRDHAWKYRDYVINAFNADKPYNDFLVEQIAGDELVDFSNPDAIDANIIEKLVATGFLRMAPDGTSANPVNRVEDRLEVIGDELQILAGGVMGLTMKCARCHDHKYDPISQRDYYSFAAIFKAAYDEYNWLTPQPFRNQWAGSTRRHLEVMLPDERKAMEERNTKLDAEIMSLEKQRKAEKDKKKKTELKKKTDELKAKKNEQPLIRALWDRGEASPTYVNLRGNPGSPGPLVQPDLPQIFSSKPFQPARATGKNKTGNRLALARWLTQPDHPLTARVWVNRVWKHHFGRGIVSSLDNFGKLGTPPTHPELLDWLAVELTKNKWSTKHLHRLICTSTAYRQSSLNAQPSNFTPSYSRMPMRRLDAEELHDGLLAITGRLNPRLGGKPDDVQVREGGYVTGKPGEGGWRRSIYIRQRRKHMMTLLETFDLPAMNPNCVTRINSTVVQQPLFLLHDKVVHDLSRKLAAEIQKEAKGIEPVIRLAYRKIVNRSPSKEELARTTVAMNELEREFTAAKQTGQRNKALAVVCHALFNSAAFLYID